MNISTNLGKIIADGTMQAFVLHNQRGGHGIKSTDALIVSLRTEAKAALASVLAMGARLLDGFLWESEASELFGEILCGTPWRDDTIRAYGRVCRVPRRAQYFGSPTIAPYTYSSITMAPLPWSAPLESLRQDVQLATGERFNAALVNLYVDGSHCVGWHSDDEPGVGDTIASVSLGATRDFRLRRIADASDQRKLALVDGSLLVMRGETQRLWQHSLPKRKGVRMPRINVTFRQMS